MERAMDDVALVFARCEQHDLPGGKKNVHPGGEGRLRNICIIAPVALVRLDALARKPNHAGRRIGGGRRFVEPDMAVGSQSKDRQVEPTCGVHGRIETASGPWRTSGDWWRPNAWDREEWDIELLDALYRIYYDVHFDRWFVQGVYD